MIQRLLGLWNALIPGAKMGAVVAAVLMLLALWQFVIMPRWDSWRAGIDKARQANTEAVQELNRSVGEMQTERESIKSTLEDYERTQKSLAETAKIAAEFKRKAAAAEVSAASRDRRIAELESALMAAEAKRKAQPKLGNLEELQSALRGFVLQSR